MTVVTPTVPSPGDEANATDISTPVQQLANVINGGLDDTNISALSGSKIAAGTLDTAQLKDSGVTTSKLADGAVTAAKLSTSAITLGYAKITAGISSTTTGHLQVTGLTVTCTIPAGNRNIRISTFGQGVRGNTTGNLYGVSLWDGAVGTGTQIAAAYTTVGGANYTVPAIASAFIPALAAGSKTYNVALFTGAGTAAYDAAATTPAYLIVKAI